MSNALGTTELFLAGTYTLQKDKGDRFIELTFFLLQIDQGLGAAQLLLSDSIVNVALSKREKLVQISSFWTSKGICYLHIQLNNSTDNIQ